MNLSYSCPHRGGKPRPKQRQFLRLFPNSPEFLMSKRHAQTDPAKCWIQTILIWLKIIHSGIFGGVLKWWYPQSSSIWMAWSFVNHAFGGPPIYGNPQLFHFIPCQLGHLFGRLPSICKRLESWIVGRIIPLNPHACYVCCLNPNEIHMFVRLNPMKSTLVKIKSDEIPLHPPKVPHVFFWWNRPSPSRSQAAPVVWRLKAREGETGWEHHEDILSDYEMANKWYTIWDYMRYVMWDRISMDKRCICDRIYEYVWNHLANKKSARTSNKFMAQ